MEEFSLPVARAGLVLSGLGLEWSGLWAAGDARGLRVSEWVGLDGLDLDGPAPDGRDSDELDPDERVLLVLEEAACWRRDSPVLQGLAELPAEEWASQDSEPEWAPVREQWVCRLQQANRWARGQRSVLARRAG